MMYADCPACYRSMRVDYVDVGVGYVWHGIHCGWGHEVPRKSMRSRAGRYTGGPHDTPGGCMTKPWRLLGAGAVAASLGVATSTVAQWRRRGREYGIPFPEPRAETSTKTPGVYVLGWEESQIPEIRAWKSEIEARRRGGGKSA